MIERKEALEKIRGFMFKDIIKVIMGIRRSGKSTLLQEIIDLLKSEGVDDENILLVNFESQKYQDINTKSKLNELINDSIKNTEGKVFLLFDEIQNVDEWEIAVNGFRVDHDCDIYITGSNSKLLSGELQTHLTGRYITINLYPFSFKEILNYHGENLSRDEEYDIFMDYLKYGGMPFLYDAHLNEKQKEDYLSDLFSAIVHKDIIERYDAKDSFLLNKLSHFIFDNIGRNFSANNIHNFLKHEEFNVSVAKIYNYITYMENASLIHKVQREEINGKGILKYNEKYYITDLGFRKIICKSQGSISQLLENMVYIELLRRGYEVTVGKFRDYEVDFVAKTPNDEKYIQVSYLLLDDETRKREFRPLEKINDNYPKYVLSMDRVDFSYNGIKHMNVIDFLKYDNW